MPQTPLIDDPLIQQFSRQLFTRLQAKLADLPLSDGEIELLIRCCNDGASLQVRAMQSRRDDREQQHALRRERAELNAQLLNIAAGAKARVANAFWEQVRIGIVNAMSIAMGGV